MRTNVFVFSLIIFIFLGMFLYEATDGFGDVYKVPIPLKGSLQNPAWSPDGRSILFTHFRDGYNKGEAALFIFDLETRILKLLVKDGSENVNLPGAAWNKNTNNIVFSSSRESHDEIYIISSNGFPGDEIQITKRPDKMAYEPSFSPSGGWIVFESHEVDVEEEGIITKYRIDKSTPYISLTKKGQDCRQPNWSPRGDCIVYQRLSNARWDIWITDPKGVSHKKITNGPGDKTDASFSPDGKRIIYSADGENLTYANLFITSLSGEGSVRLTFHKTGYDGAPAWSPDGKRVIFESCEGQPEESHGTTIWIIGIPKELLGGRYEH